MIITEDFKVIECSVCGRECCVPPPFVADGYICWLCDFKSKNKVD